MAVMVKDVDIAYCAGLFEGEGSFPVTRTYKKRNGTTARRKKTRVLIAIAMTDIEPLERFANTFTASRINGPYVYGTYKPVYRLCINKKAEVKKAVDAMWPYLSTRRKKQWEQGHVHDTI